MTIFLQIEKFISHFRNNQKRETQGLLSCIRLFTLPFFLSIKLLSQTQSPPYGNEWINYTQKYLEFKITDTGIYRINYAALSKGLDSIGLSIGNADPRKIQIFGRGQEQYIYIEGESDSSFDSNDFIEFFACGNDGWFDSLLYVTPDDQSNPFYSLFNDTATYYLTISTDFGKRMDTLGFSGTGTDADYFLKEEVVSFHNNFFQGEYFGSANGPAHPLYKAGKGWFSGNMNSGGSISVAINTSNSYSLGSAPDAIATVVLAGTNSNIHNIKIDYGISDTADSFNGYLLKKYNFSISPANLSPSTNFTISSTSTPNPQSPDYSALSHLYLKYPRNFNFSGISKAIMILPPSPSESSLVTLSSYPNPAIVYDLTSHKRIQTQQFIGNILKFTIPAANSERQCFLFPPSQVASVSTFFRVTENNKFTDFLSLEKDSAFVIITHPKLMNGATAYKDYRTSTAVLANVEELYDQFGYGINKHPLAIRNFCRFLLDTFSTPPQHLFFIGKGIANGAFSTRNDSSLSSKNLVPTFGWPGSDGAFTSGLTGSQVEPAIPTGRIAAITNQEVEDYLDKVIAFEKNLFETEQTQKSIPERIWMKEAIHFCGGNDADQGNQFCGYLKQYEDAIEDELYGAHVTTVAKNSTVPIQVNLTDSITKLIEKGVSVMTFFGHSSSNYTDVSIGYAKDYNIIKGRYPLMIANGCFSGDIFTGSSGSTSEDFVLIKDKGAIAYIAHAGLGFAGDLHNYTNSLYKNISKKSYGKSIGYCVKQGIADYQPSGFVPVSTALGMTLHGDPSIIINTHLLPDYAIAPELVYFSPAEVTNVIDSFQIKVVVANIGRADTDSVSVFIRQTLPNGNINTFKKILSHVFYLDTVIFTLPVDKVNGLGLNQFYIHVDENNVTPEISELNNIIGENQISLFIKSGDLIPVYPYNYAVVPNNSIVLKASTSDPFAPLKEYIFQIDTTDSYSSNMLRQFVVSGGGGVIRWNIDTNYFNLGNNTDSTAFFWRTSPNTPSDFHWREHTFQIISGKRGWGQKHFFQFKNDAFENIDYDKNNRKFIYSDKNLGLKCDVWGHWGDPAFYWRYDQTQYFINNIATETGTVTLNWPAMYIAVIDKCSLKPWGTRRLINDVWFNPDNNFGNCNDQNGPLGRKYKVENYFVFQIDDPVQMDSMENFLNNKIPDGDYVLAYTFGNNMFSNTSVWTLPHFLAFNALGASVITQVPDSFPYIFFGQKGNPGFAKEEVGDSTYDFISLTANMEGCKGFGTVSTPVIGPAYNWGELHWKYGLYTLPDDSVEISVLDGIGNSVVTGYNNFNGDIVPLNDSVNASIHRYIKLKAGMGDTTLFSPSQLNYWYVLYNEIPEAALNSAMGFSFHDAVLQQGDKVKFKIAVENVSNTPMDSIRIKYWITDSQQNTDSTLVKKNKPLPAGDVLFDSVSFPSGGLSGNCRFWVEVNPLDTLWQLEQYHFNNLASIGFRTDKDVINPLLDITFDGIRILNGDIVSPKPEIVIQLKDENKFLALEDTAFKVFITDPDKNSERIYFVKNGVEQMRFNKAVLPDNKCKIEYHPVFAKDGIYELRVQGTDASGNTSGDLDYSITFEVINKSTITEILNYPNPFSSSTRFVFTLTGADIPDFFKIQILTVTGKVIREITRSELGNIHIGRNITDYFWNGTDEFGDPLANGVYLYRTIVKLNGEEVEHRESNADNFIKKGFGKMFLMR